MSAEPQPLSDAQVQAILASAPAVSVPDGGSPPGRVITVALDDDPTGSQAVHDVDALLVADPGAVHQVLQDGTDNLFVLTNSRSMPPSEAAMLSEELAEAVYGLSGTASAVRVLSRSDSTLRGHVAGEIAAIRRAHRRQVGRPPDAVVFAPAFPAAGRVTVHGIHYARGGHGYVPVAGSEFARDATFGYTRSWLPGFLEEVTAGQLKAADVLSLDLDDIRVGGPERIADLLGGADGRWVVVDTAHPLDLQTVAAGVERAERAGASLVFRCGPSLVPALMRVDGQVCVGPEQMASATTVTGSGHGLVVVGSHTAQTTRQLQILQQEHPAAHLELDIHDILGPARDQAVAALGDRLARSLADGLTVLSTSRTLVTGADAAASLGIARSVSAALSEVVRRATSTCVPAWAVLKGGITSHDVAVSGLGVRLARVTGQAFPGLVSVMIATDARGPFRGRAFVVFPGNVGAEDGLAAVVTLLQRAAG